jgi:hypothetical protein
MLFENRVLRRIFGPKRTRRQGSGENYTYMVHNEELNDQYSSPNIVQIKKNREKIRWGEERRMQGFGGET